jgi:hypothetical protein
MLNKWIADSESNDTLMKSKKDEAQKSAEEAEKAAQKSAGIFLLKLFLFKKKIINEQ